MTRESRSIVVAMACGAFIGGIAAQVIGSSADYHYMWPAGALLGGLIAYALVDWAHFRTGVGRAWAHARADFDENIAQWRPKYRYWRLWWASFALFVQAVLSITTGLFVLVTSLIFLMLVVVALFVDIHTITNMKEVMDLLIFSAVCAAGVCAFIGLLVAPEQGNSNRTRRTWKTQRNESRQTVHLGWLLIKYGNPLGIGVLMYRGLKSAAPYTPLACRIAWAGVRCGAILLGYSIAYVHSEKRVICLADTALVVAVCYVALGSVTAVLVGTVMGPVVGLVNYWVVAPRLERLQMANANG